MHSGASLALKLASAQGFSRTVSQSFARWQACSTAFPMPKSSETPFASIRASSSTHWVAAGAGSSNGWKAMACMAAPYTLVLAAPAAIARSSSASAASGAPALPHACIAERHARSPNTTPYASADLSRSSRAASSAPARPHARSACVRHDASTGTPAAPIVSSKASAPRQSPSVPRSCSRVLYARTPIGRPSAAASAPSRAHSACASPCAPLTAQAPSASTS